MAFVNKTEIRVIYADTDQMGVVYHSNYLRYFEIGRTELLRELGISYKEMEACGLFLPVKEVYIDYKISIKYDDVIVVHTCIDKLKNVSLRLKYEIRNKEDSNLLYTTGYTLHPFINKNGEIIHPENYLYDIMAKGK
ncbi:acyl-CoA thioesterase [Brachyspira catarrhinii]|uniref:Acyl-CoA thioesterase n=1 Tax=Brachyspira catarrhinii TaxID=2528966 RepID=A0ABY2TT66_9SPIR|nr:thioesterase family protein [Brachyspira catarrhinii]TKZ35974.1 acyl-CoA thioesterase [Brachyspira catarrhinii]